MSTLPAPVQRFVPLTAGQPAARTVVMDTSAVMRGRIPLDIRISHRLGVAFAHDIRLGRRPVAVPIGADAYVDGRGLMRIGRTVSAGPHYDQGALIAMWAEALGFTSCWLGRNDVRWEAVDDATARFVVAGPEGDLPITIAFDPATGLPAASTVDRYKADGPKVGWTGRTLEWRRMSGVMVPARFEAQWADEPAPWIVLRTRSVRLDAPVDAALDGASRLLNKARAQQTR